MAKKTRVSKRKLSGIADKLKLTVDAVLDMLLAKESSHSQFTRTLRDEGKEKQRRRMRKASWKKNRGWR